MKFYHFIYKITNLVNSKFYYGIHTTDDLEDGYMGSGKLLKVAIKKYGISNFQREVLFMFDSRKEALAKEREIVNSDLLCDALCYNLVVGGAGPHSLEGRRGFRRSKPIYNKQAKEVIFRDNIETRLYEDRKIVFTINDRSLMEYQAQVNMTKMEPLRRSLNNILIKNFSLMAKGLTDLYNDKRYNKKAEEVLNKLAGKNLISCINAYQTPWETGEKQVSNAVS